jgi:hypothetical protein
MLATLSAKEVRVALVFHQTVLGGVMKIPGTSRVTDHLCGKTQFVTLFRAQLYPMAEGQSLSEIKPSARCDFVTVNTHLATGVIEG